MFRRLIRVRGQYKGFHKYENAPDKVAFLRELHRHIFKWEAMIQVEHNDRELEFFMVQDMIEQQIAPFISMSGNMGSCEQQAERILKGLINAYGPQRMYIVTVSEDGENDGIVQWAPSKTDRDFLDRVSRVWEIDSSSQTS